jgi:hypothetical protein
LTILALIWLLAAPVMTPPQQPATPDSLAQARLRYNERRFDEAIQLATEARRVPGLANAATVVLARALLERYRDRQDEVSLPAAREALRAVDGAKLSPKDHIEYLVGLGESLYLDAEASGLDFLYGGAAELFQQALAEAEVVTPESTEPLFEWWANATDRQAQFNHDLDRRHIYARLLDGAERYLARRSRSAVATYWLAAAARGTGDLDRALGAATAGWIRSPEFGEAGAKLRGNLDDLVLRVILPERAMRLAPDGGAVQLLENLRSQWAALKAQWGGV